MENSTGYESSSGNYTTAAPELTTSLLKARPHLTGFILFLYVAIFLIGVLGNGLVLFVVAKFKSMQTITNRFIACLSISDLLICLFAIPFTPINALMTSWIFGKVLCRLVPIILVLSVFVSSLTSVVIALDRYMVIVHPHTPRMTENTQIGIIISIWLLAASAAIPIGIYTTLDEWNGAITCQEKWPSTNAPIIYTWMVFSLQLVIPAIIITVCYTRVSIQLARRSRKRVGSRDYYREKAEVQRNHKINRMLIAMIAIFILCWLPLGLFHLVMKILPPDYQIIVFLFVHVIAMSSVIYNPFLYGWMNENFNKHFRQLGSGCAKVCCPKREPLVEKETTMPSALRTAQTNGHTKSGCELNSSATSVEEVEPLMEK